MSKEDTNGASNINEKKTNGGAVKEAKSSLDAVFRRKLQAFIALVTLVYILARAEVQYYSGRKYHCLVVENMYLPRY